MHQLPIIQSPLSVSTSASQDSAGHPLCGGCGECCRHVGRPPFLPGDSDFERLPPDLKAEVLASRQRPLRDRECDWFEVRTGRCRHYNHRPILCREFGAESAACLATRRLAGLLP